MSNIYQTLFDLLNTYIFGGTVVGGTYQELVCILVSVIACLFCMALPFLVVKKIIDIL